MAVSTSSLSTSKIAYRRVKQSTADSVEGPNVDQEGEAVCHCDPDNSVAGQCAIRSGGRLLKNSNNVAGIAKVQEEESADKFTRRRYHVSAEFAEMGSLLLMVVVVAIEAIRTVNFCSGCHFRNVVNFRAR